MSSQEYWDGDPYMAVIYRDVDTRIRKDKNQFLWLQGLYFYEALSVVMHNAFVRKGRKLERYPDEPYRITPPTAEEKKAAAKREREKAIKSLNAWKTAWDKQNGRPKS